MENNTKIQQDTNDNLNITADEIVNYITQNQSKDKATVTQIDENTTQINIDKELAKDYIDTLKLNRDTADDLIKNEEASEKAGEKANRFRMDKDAAFSNVQYLNSDRLSKKLERVTISDTEKDIYISKLLSDSPFELDINYPKLNLTLTFRSKYVYEQEFISRYIKQAILSDKGKEMTPDELCIFVFKSNVAVMLTSLNYKPFFKVDFPLYDVDSHYISYTDYVDVLNQRIATLSSINQQLWSLIIDAACIFEKKQQLLAEFVANEDF